MGIISPRSTASRPATTSTGPTWVCAASIGWAACSSTAPPSVPWGPSIRASTSPALPSILPRRRAHLQLCDPGRHLCPAVEHRQSHPDRLAVVPEMSGNVGYDLTANIRAYVGYTFLYIDNVARPGTQIDHALNNTQIPFGGTGSTLVGPPVRSSHSTGRFLGPGDQLRPRLEVVRCWNWNRMWRHVANVPPLTASRLSKDTVGNRPGRLGGPASSRAQLAATRSREERAAQRSASPALRCAARSSRLRVAANQDEALAVFRKAGCGNGQRLRSPAGSGWQVSFLAPVGIVW